MPICCFDNDFAHKYRCQYSVESELIRVNVEYDIGQEIELPDGSRTWSVDTAFKERDILIVDADDKKSFLLKDARFAGKSSRYGPLDSRDTTSFVSQTYFESSQTENLMKLASTPKIQKIKFYSQSLGEYTGHPSVSINNSENEYSIIMSRQNNARGILINVNNIKGIDVADYWSSERHLSEISIEMSGYLEIELARKVKYTEVGAYVYEMMIYLQLYRPGKFRIDRLVVDIDGCEYEFFTSLRRPKYTEKNVDYSTKLDLLDFLKDCYIKIPYRKSKNEIRNIPYVVMNSSRSIEDNYLMLYRFIECYYKRKSVKTFMETCINEHYKEKHNLTDDQVERFAREVICLRNHYVHSGYFIKNSNLKIKFQKGKKDPRDYTAKVNFEWIFERTKILYLMVIDIIFAEMLGIKSYCFDRSI